MSFTAVCLTLRLGVLERKGELNECGDGLVKDLVQIKVFGERHTATRAIIKMIDEADGVGGAGHPGVKARDLQPYREMFDQLLEVMNGPWKKVYREAVRDLQDDKVGPVGAWKHAAPRYGGEFKTYDVRVLFTVRNPYSWIVSLHKRPYHYLGAPKADFLEFLKFPWVTMGRDRVEQILGSPMDLWSRKLEAYQTFEAAALADGTPVETLKFEEFVQDPSQYLGAALSALSGHPIKVEELETPMKRDGLKTEARRVRYRDELWRKDLTADCVEVINGRVNWEIAARYGYARLSPNDFPEVL